MVAEHSVSLNHVTQINLYDSGHTQPRSAVKVRAHAVGMSRATRFANANLGASPCLGTFIASECGTGEVLFVRLCLRDRRQPRGHAYDWLAVGLDLRVWLPAGAIYVGAEAGFRLGADLSRNETLHYSTRVGGFVGYSYHLGEKWQLRPELVGWGRQAEQRMDGAAERHDTHTWSVSPRLCCIRHQAPHWAVHRGWTNILGKQR